VKTYVLVTGILFALLTLVHVWRMIEEAAPGHRSLVPGDHGRGGDPESLGVACAPAREPLVGSARGSIEPAPVPGLSMPR